MRAQGLDRWLPIMLGALVGLGAVGAAMWAGPTPSEQALLAARWTARVMFPLFLVAYLASSLARLWPNDWTRAILRHRRQWGLGFALALTIHLVALLVNIIGFRPRPFASLIGGMVAYLLAYLMAATSNNAAMRRLGQGWRWLHRIGIHVVWFVFLAGYGGRITNPDPSYHLTGWIGTLILLAALALRLYAARAKPRLA